MRRIGPRLIPAVTIALALAAHGCNRPPPEQPPTPEPPAVAPAPAPTPTPAPKAGDTPPKLPEFDPAPAAKASSPSEVVLASGMSYRVLKPGTGPKPKLGSSVVYHWTGWLGNGRQVWDTRRTGVPQTDTLDRMLLIPGLVDALLDMQVGERREVRLPSHLAYGDRGAAKVVPPRSELRLDVELVRIGS